MFEIVSDFVCFVGWLWDNISILLRNVFLPVQYIYTFLKGFFGEALKIPATPETIWSFDTGTKQIFASIPYFDTLISVAIAGITILMIIFILKSFQRS